MILISAMRPYQWAKNVLVLLPLLTAHLYGDPAAVTAAVIGFAAFSICASGVYLVNDIFDIDADRRHPVKRHRPLARGDLSTTAAAAAALCLFAVAFAGALALLPAAFAVALGIYLAATFLYTLWLKRKSTIDVLTLAGLYSLRIIAGSLAIGVLPSFWILAFSMFLFASLAYLKRYGELAAGGEDGQLGRGYQPQDSDAMFTLGAINGSLAVLVMALYINSADVQSRYATPELLWPICLALLYWINRIWMQARHGQIGHDPILFILRDRVSGYVVVFSVAMVVCAQRINIAFG